MPIATRPANGLSCFVRDRGRDFFRDMFMISSKAANPAGGLCCTVSRSTYETLGFEPVSCDCPSVVNDARSVGHGYDNGVNNLHFERRGDDQIGIPGRRALCAVEERAKRTQPGFVA